MRYPRQKGVWRKVESISYYSPTNNPHPGYPCSAVLELECGHSVGRKASAPIPKKVYCTECTS